MTALSSLQDGLSSAIGEISEFVSDNPIGVAAGVAGAAVVGAGIVALASNGNKRKASKKTKKGRARDRKYISKQKHEQAYLKKHPKRRKSGKYYKSKSSSKRRGKVYYARKTGQPYIILASGKAKFIKGKRRNK